MTGNAFNSAQAKPTSLKMPAAKEYRDFRKLYEQQKDIDGLAVETFVGLPFALAYFAWAITQQREIWGGGSPQGIAGGFHLRPSRVSDASRHHDL